MNAAVRLPDAFDDDGGAALQRDPFETRYDDACYFDEAVRTKRLNLLFHLIPYSDVLLVTGEAGSGKTCLLHRLLAGASDSWRICRFQAAAEIDGTHLLEILEREFSLRPDASDDAERRLRLLRESLYALRHGALVPVLLVDDAHLLSHSALTLLAALTEPWEGKDKLLCVVLFGEPEISKRLSAPGLEALRARVGHSFDIPPLSEADTARYIRHRLQAAGIGGGPFTDAVVRFIHVASRGFPGRINEFARVVLHNSEQKVTRTAPPLPFGSRAKVYLKYAAAAALASAAAVGLLYQDRLMEFAGHARRPAAVSSPPAEVAATAPIPPPVAEQPPQEPGPASPPAGAAASAPEADELAPQELTEDAGAVPTTDATASGMDGQTAEPPSPQEAQQVLPPAAVARVENAPVTTPSSLPDAAATAPAAGAGPRDEDWLLAQDPQAYTLQLLVAPRAQCLAYIGRHGLGDAAALYQTRSSGQVWSSLVYGVFATEADAADAGKAISEQDVNAKPWVRKMALVQARIREFRAATAPPAPISEKPVTENTNNKGVPDAAAEVRREDWLREQPPEAYTLQLFSGKEANVMAYLRRHALGDQVALFAPADAAERLTVAYGLYPTRAAALQAGQELAARLPDLKPWARSLREIQAIISLPQSGAVAAPMPSPPQPNQ